MQIVHNLVRHSEPRIKRLIVRAAAKVVKQSSGEAVSGDCFIPYNDAFRPRDAFPLAASSSKQLGGASIIVVMILS